MFGNRISEFTLDDILRFVAESVPEGLDIEFKATLPARNGDDPWIEEVDDLPPREAEI